MSCTHRYQLLPLLSCARLTSWKCPFRKSTRRSKIFSRPNRWILRYHQVSYYGIYSWKHDLVCGTKSLNCSCSNRSCLLNSKSKKIPPTRTQPVVPKIKHLPQFMYFCTEQWVNISIEMWQPVREQKEWLSQRVFVWHGIRFAVLSHYYNIITTDLLVITWSLCVVEESRDKTVNDIRVAQVPFTTKVPYLQVP